mgnify:CR=1 FL=1
MFLFFISSNFSYSLYFSFLFTLIICGSYCILKDLYLNKDNYKMIKNQKMGYVCSTKSELIMQYKTILPTVLLNSFLIIPLFINIFNKFYYIEYNINNFNIFNSILSLVLGLLLLDFTFYIGQYIMHNKYLYLWSHKKHHEFRFPVGIEALYLHWFDLIFGNIIPLYLPIILLNNHILTLVFWNILTIGSTILIAHSSNNDDFHLIHHMNSKYNYGHGIYMDKLLGSKFMTHQD